MHKERFKELLRTMKRAKKSNQQLKMNVWVDTINLKKKAINGIASKKTQSALGADKNTEVHYLKEGWCGAAACVAGTAAQNKKFNELGLRIAIQTSDDSLYMNAEVVYERESEKTLLGSKALSTFFDISGFDTELIFGSNYNFDTKKFYTGDGYFPEDITIDHVIARLERVISEGEINL